MPETESSAVSTAPRPGCVRRLLKWLFRIAGVLIVLVVLALLVGGLWLRGWLTASLPELDGEQVVDGIAEPVSLERDALGVVRIRGVNRDDVAFGTGFAHAQDRFFQMDLMRRQAAGEMAALVGRPVLRLDRSRRIYRFRAVAEEVLAAMPAERRALLDAYTAGVNAGLASLEAAPVEYAVLKAAPQPWTPQDSVLVILTMFVLLQDDGDDEALLALMHDRLPAPLYEFLTPLGTPWDAPISGEPLAMPPLPAGKVDPKPAPPEPGAGEEDDDEQGASNAWAVAGQRTADGRALVAVDTHMGLVVPNTWYRASLVWPAAGGEEHHLSGATLPGAPLVVIGSNGHLAWGLANARIDASDLVIVERDPADADAYLTPDGPEPFVHHRELLRVHGAEDQELDVVWTRWGPVVGEDHEGRPRALRWLAHDPQAVDLEFIGLEQARGIEEAIEIAQRSGIPAQNLVVADDAGRVGWTIAGRLPRRVGLEGRLPASWADGSRGWDGLLPPAEIPRVIDPPSGLIWTANQRMVDGEDLAKLGTGGSYVLGARARQIRDQLEALEAPTVEQMLELQLDDRSPFLEPWRDLLLAILTPEALEADGRRQEFRRFVAEWQGRAAIDSVGYRLIREYRDALAEAVFRSLAAPCYEADPEFDYYDEYKQAEGPLWTLVHERPAHLLSPAYGSWDEQLLAVVDAVLDQAEAEGIPLAERTWGRRNMTAIRHLFSYALPPAAGRWLNMPVEPLPGDRFLPRVQDPDSGASLRMVVSPGREAEGIFHMPGGQSGHFLSPHYRDSHPAWARGEATRLLLGEVVATLVLTPASG
ncbi:MAG: penicillin acylase family protein [bacterium]|nr:penicillin acylase family protein [bacterium]